MDKKELLQEMREDLQNYLNCLDDLLVSNDDLDIIYELTGQLYDEISTIVEE